MFHNLKFLPPFVIARSLRRSNPSRIPEAVERDCFAALAMTLCFMFLLTGCSERTATITATQPMPQVEVRDADCQAVNEMDFLDCMVRKTKCTVADAVRAVTILSAGHDVAATYEARYDYLLERGIVRTEWKLAADEWIDKGTLAYMLYKTAGMKGGVNMAIFGNCGLGDRRYAYREMRYRELMLDGVDYNYISGPELVTTVGGVDRYIQEREQNSPAAATALGDNPQNPPQ